MKRPSPWLTIKYHARAIYRALLTYWYGVEASLEEWWHRFVRNHIVGELPPIRVAVYPRRQPASRGQIGEWLVIVGKDVPLSEGVDQYLHFLEKYLPPLPTERHT